MEKNRIRDKHPGSSTLLFRVIYLFELHGDQLVSLLLESFDNLSDQSAMNAIGFDHDEGSLGVGHFGNAELQTEILRYFDFDSY
jgi:hypothetical protein